jgi:hypothetical protein
MARMDRALRLDDATLRAEIENAARELEIALQTDVRIGARRRLLRDDLNLEWESVPLRSLWLVSHRGLRRAGFRAHPESTAVLVAWRGEGLVLLRPPGERSSRSLVPWDTPPREANVRSVVVPAGTPYDTLADAAPWHVIAAHSHRGAGLVRRQLVRGEDAEQWIEMAEEESS